MKLFELVWYGRNGNKVAQHSTVENHSNTLFIQLNKFRPKRDVNHCTLDLDAIYSNAILRIDVICVRPWWPNSYSLYKCDELTWVKVFLALCLWKRRRANKRSTSEKLTIEQQSGWQLVFSVFGLMVFLFPLVVSIQPSSSPSLPASTSSFTIAIVVQWQTVWYDAIYFAIGFMCIGMSLNVRSVGLSEDKLCRLQSITIFYGFKCTSIATTTKNTLSTSTCSWMVEVCIRFIAILKTNTIYKFSFVTLSKLLTDFHWHLQPHTHTHA